MELLDLAQAIATEAHQGQFRRDGTTPYIEHPASVVSRVGDDLDAKVVSWLHDVLEDSDFTSDDLVQRGILRHCVAAIELMTKEDGMTYDLYLHKVAASDLATRVKIADMLTNLSDTPTLKQIRKYAKALLFLTEKIEKLPWDK